MGITITGKIDYVLVEKFQVGFVEIGPRGEIFKIIGLYDNRVSALAFLNFVINNSDLAEDFEIRPIYKKVKA